MRKFRGLDYDISKEAWTAIQQMLYPRLKEQCVLESWNAAAIELKDMGIATEAEEGSKTQFFKPGAVEAGFPSIEVGHADMFFRYLSKGNMVQIGFNPETNMYEEVVFTCLGKFYYMSTHVCGVYSYNPAITRNEGTENYRNLKYWTKVTLSEKKVGNGKRSNDRFTYLRLILQPGGLTGHYTLKGEEKTYYVIQASHIVVSLHRLAFYLFHPCTDYTFFRSKDINHMLAGSSLFFDALSTLSMYDSYEGDKQRLFSEFASLPQFLELSTRRKNIKHGNYTMKNDYRCIPVSVSWIPSNPDDLLSDEDVQEGLNILLGTLRSLDGGFSIISDVRKICETHLKK